MNIPKKWIVIGVVVIALFTFGKYNESKQKENATTDPVKEIIVKPLTYREKFDKKHFSEFNGYYKPVQKYLKEYLNDPASLEFINTWNTGMNKDSSFSTKATFRAKNSFNALVKQSIYCNIDFDGNVKDVKIE